MRDLDDAIAAGDEPTTLRRLHEAGRLVPGMVDHRQMDDWSAGGDLFYVQDSRSGDLWPVSEALFHGLFGAAGRQAG